MAEVTLEALTDLVSESEPCGPDLDLIGDPDYMNFVAKAESLIPTTYFSGPENKPFDRASIDFAAEFVVIKKLLARTRDIRLITILAKYCILNRDLTGFETAVRAIDQLLKERWDDVHPRGEDGVFSARMAAIETLDDLPPVIFPLQYSELVRHPRLGPISYRDYMIATGEAQAREGEKTSDQTAIENGLMEVNLTELVDTLGRFDALRTALADIRSVCAERAGFEQAAKFERLPALVDNIRSLLNNTVIKRDPAAALGDVSQGDSLEATGGTAPVVTGDVRSVEDAADALAAIAEYFGRHEPSNPALLLVQQAAQLMGKSFVEVLRILMPTHVEQAAIYIGGSQTVPLPIERLSGLVSSYNSDQEPSPPPRRLEATSRPQALRLLEQIGAFYRNAEPSSPLPFLTDRARELASRDFLSLLKHVLPQEALNSSPPEDQAS